MADEDEGYRRTIVEQCAHYMRQVEMETTFYSASHLASWNAARIVFEIPMKDVLEEKARQETAKAEFVIEQAFDGAKAAPKPIHSHPNPYDPEAVVPCCGRRLFQLPEGSVTTTDPKVVTCGRGVTQRDTA